tara:strand:+ start:3012 stop:3338 length:327 start_codon:yes stop_codon:yes gene_type:complete
MSESIEDALRVEVRELTTKIKELLSRRRVLEKALGALDPVKVDNRMKSVTLADRLEGLMLDSEGLYRVKHLSNQILEVSRSTVNACLNKNTNRFERVGHGLYKLRGDS